MPPHGHGGHHGGGHHGHHGHHPGGWQGGWGPGWSGPGYWGAQPAYAELVVVPSCPGTLDPVLATDGKVYNNPCLAREAGVSVVKRVKPGRLAGLGDVVPGVPNVALLAGAAITAYLLLRRKRR